MTTTEMNATSANAFALSHPEHNRSLSVLILDEVESHTVDETPLAAPETKMLTHYESIIKGSLAAFWQVGEALSAIKRGKLYRQTHKSFEAYCLDKWGFGRHRAFQLMSANQTAQEILTSGIQIPDLNERQLRMLTPVDANKRAEVIQKAGELAGTSKPRAKHVNAAIKQILNPKTRKTTELAHVELVSADYEPDVPMPSVTVDMLTDRMEEISEEVERKDCPQSIRNSLGTLFAMIQAFLRQTSGVAKEVV